MLRILLLRSFLILYLYRKFVKFISTPSRNSRLKIFYFNLIVAADRFRSIDSPRWILERRYYIYNIFNELSF